MTATPATTAEHERPFSIVAGILSYLIPGLGQIVQGRVVKGLLFMVTLLGLFHVGEYMGGWMNVYVPRNNGFGGPRNLNPLGGIVNQRWHYAGQFWIGIAAWPALWQYYAQPVAEPWEQQTFAQKYQKQPPEHVVNELFRVSDKTPDLGWIYTVIAGMLNILVIYDAYAGPAYGAGIPKDAKKPKPEESAA